jgi:hypothetical protein
MYILYASTVDSLESEYELFLHDDVDTYSKDKTKEQKEKIFIKRIEEIITSKSRSYISYSKVGKTAQSGDDDSSS